ncbi:MFS transporter [Clostridium sp. HV4-5-A1G]|uniref:MFS transporter n=1 Tax=Clostridium sp. HV4-5-A1G TaxID=2004595 RepID=UPI00123A0BE8|nr:MFS transporter [Clostridium sp. HV4-5-A1G]KAA8674491.1 MHS family MFS transporter [Clostridium sp. HV4-5-A1G]
MLESTERSQARQAGIAALVGTVLEWYDFLIYGASAALVLNKVFFPAVDPLMGTLAAFGTYAVGFLARPLGGLVLGHLGDKVGRKIVLILTLFLMGGSTTAVGFLPTYNSIGILAPIALIILRLIQGFGAGGEYAGAVVLSVEHAKKGKRGLAGAWAPMGFSAATVLANGVFFSCLSIMGKSVFVDWGWRIPFIFGAVCVIVGYFIRRHIVEPPSFEKAKIAREQSGKHIGIFSAIKRYPREVLIVIGTRMGENGFAYFYPVFIMAYIVNILGLPESTALWGVIIASLIQVIFMPLFGMLSDKIGRKPVYIGGTIVSMAWLIPFFMILGTGSLWAIILGFIIGFGIAYPALISPQASWYAELFDTDFRVCGFAFSRELGSILAGGLAPFICTALYSWSRRWWPIVVYMCVLGVITLIALAMGPETVNKNIEE